MFRLPFRNLFYLLILVSSFASFKVEADVSKIFVSVNDLKFEIKKYSIQTLDSSTLSLIDAAISNHQIQLNDYLNNVFLNYKDSLISDLNLEINKLEKNVEALNTQVLEVKKREKVLSDDLSEKRKTFSENLKSSQADILDLNKELSAKKKLLSDLNKLADEEKKNSKAELEQRQIKLQEKLTDLNKKIETLENEIKTISTKHESIIKSKKEEIASVQASLEKLTQKHTIQIRDKDLLKQRLKNKKLEQLKLDFYNKNEQLVSVTYNYDNSYSIVNINGISIVNKSKYEIADAEFGLFYKSKNKLIDITSVYGSFFWLPELDDFEKGQNIYKERLTCIKSNEISDYRFNALGFNLSEPDLRKFEELTGSVNYQGSNVMLKLKNIKFGEKTPPKEKKCKVIDDFFFSSDVDKFLQTSPEISNKTYEINQLLNLIKNEQTKLNSLKNEISENSFLIQNHKKNIADQKEKMDQYSDSLLIVKDELKEIKLNGIISKNTKEKITKTENKISAITKKITDSKLKIINDRKEIKTLETDLNATQVSLSKKQNDLANEKSKLLNVQIKSEKILSENNVSSPDTHSLVKQKADRNIIREFELELEDEFLEIVSKLNFIPVDNTKSETFSNPSSKFAIIHKKLFRHGDAYFIVNYEDFKSGKELNFKNITPSSDEIKNLQKLF